jgi:hypothetical protein
MLKFKAFSEKTRNAGLIFEQSTANRTRLGQEPVQEGRLPCPSPLLQDGRVTMGTVFSLKRYL